MMRKSGVGGRIAKELDEVRREFAEKNGIHLTEADREIAKAIKDLKGKVKVKEIRF